MKTVAYLALTAARNGELKPASICSSHGNCSALGRAEFVHLQSTDCILSPPPPCDNSVKSPFFSKFSTKTVFLSALIFVLSANLYAQEKKASLGINATASSNFKGITVIELAALFRWCFLDGYSGFFLQKDCEEISVFLLKKLNYTAE
jgi:hypothetical protein